ncbi:MAG: glycosyltransferase family 4 protein [Armatimonadota bacterium]|nr:glycosyltransferase family 4 protein [Armatimonadota bacterium]
MASKRQTDLKKTILFLDHTAQMGGGEVALFNLVTALDSERFTPVVLLASDGPLVERLRGTGVETHLLPLDPSVVGARKGGLGASSLLHIAQAARMVGYVLRLARWARGRRVDLIHTNSLKADIYGGLAGRLARVPVLWHIRDHIDGEYLPPRVAATFRLLARTLPTAVVAISESVRRRLASRPGQPVKVVHDGCALHWFAVPALAAGPPPAAPVVALIGRIAAWKGQHVFLRAAALTLRDRPGVRFQIVGSAMFGEEEYERSLHDLAGELGLGDRIEFLGFRDDVPALLASTDVVVHASTLGEPFGQVVIEGMAAGRPVVATNAGALPEIITDGETGLLVPPDDARAIASAIASLLDNPARAHAIGSAARERVRERFTVARTCDHIQVLYDQILRTAEP